MNINNIFRQYCIIVCECISYYLTFEYKLKTHSSNTHQIPSPSLINWDRILTARLIASLRKVMMVQVYAPIYSIHTFIQSKSKLFWPNTEYDCPNTTLFNPLPIHKQKVERLVILILRSSYSIMWSRWMYLVMD